MDEETSSGQPISGVCLLGCCDSCRPKPIVISSWWLKEGKDLPRIHFIDTWNNERPGRYCTQGFTLGTLWDLNSVFLTDSDVQLVIATHAI